MAPRSATAMTAIALGMPLAMSMVPSMGSTATSHSGPWPSPTCSPLKSIGAWSFSPSPMTTTPFMLTVPMSARIASTAAPSPPFLSPRPTQRPAAMAAASVTRTRSRAMLRSRSWGTRAPGMVASSRLAYPDPHTRAGGKSRLGDMVNNGEVEPDAPAAATTPSLGKREGRSPRDMALSLAVLLVPIALLLVFYRVVLSGDAPVNVDPAPAFQEARAAAAFTVLEPQGLGD